MIDFIPDAQVKPLSFMGSFIATMKMFKREIHVGNGRLRTWFASPLRRYAGLSAVSMGFNNPVVLL